MPAHAPDGPASHSRLGGVGIHAALVCAVLLAGGLAFVAMEDAFAPRTSVVAVLIASAALVLVGLLMLSLRDLRNAESRADAAIERVTAAEAAEHARADSLARVLEASRTLRLAGDGRVDYLGVLAAITPPGTTSFLVRRGEEEGRVEAAHGPLAPMVFGYVGTVCLPANAVEIRTFRAGEPGRPAGVEHLATLGVSIQSGVAIPLVAYDGRSMGSLHLIDPTGDRVLERSFVALAQLVANQIAVAMENDDLLAYLRRQLVEVQRVQQQLVHASKLGAIGELAAAVAHEVNNPLTGILGFAELLLTELPPDDARRGEVAIIRDEAMRARSIVRSLLDFARPHTPHRVESDLGAIARVAVDLVRYRAQESHVSIHEEYGDVPAIELDPDSLRQVILNLCANGIEAMPKGGDLTVATVVAEDRVGIMVKDTGVGMDQNTRTRIFTPFLSTRARGGYGTGLGLSVSLNIVEGHGGTIDVQSGPGEGSAFTVWIPRTPAQDVPGTKPAGVEVAA